MSVTTSLERIERWAAQHDPQFVALLQPGLSRQEIDSQVSSMPFALAEEVYELYQWHNGQEWGEFRLGLCLSGQERFMPLAEAVRAWETYLGASYRDELENLNPLAAQAGGWPAADSVTLEAGGWLPVFHVESDCLASLGTKAGVQTAPLVYVSHDDRSALFYDSLNIMLGFHADLLESGALRVDVKRGDFFEFTLLSALRRKHFPEKVVQAEEAYRLGKNLSEGLRDSTPARPSPEEFAQERLLTDLVRSGSEKAVPATEEFLLWLLGDAEQAHRITQSLVRSRYEIMYDWPYERSLIVQNLPYSFGL